MFDRILAFVMLIALSPVFLIVILLILLMKAAPFRSCSCGSSEFVEKDWLVEMNGSIG